MAMFMAPHTDRFYAALRIVSGLLFAFHGTQKLFGWPVPAHDAPPFIIYGAGSIELIGGLLVMVGLQTRWAAFICSGTMAVAYWMAHGLKALYPIANGGEMAILYCFIFLLISGKGPGIWSVDDALGSKA